METIGKIKSEMDENWDPCEDFEENFEEFMGNYIDKGFFELSTGDIQELREYHLDMKEEIKLREQQNLYLN